MATIIKAESQLRHVSTHDVRPVAFDLLDMSAKATEYLDAVRGEAAKIVQEAHQKANHIRQAAEQAGRQSAMQAANQVLEEKVGERIQTILPALQKAVAQLQDERTTWHRQCERTLVHLAVAIAERLVRRELKVAPEIPLEWIRESLEVAAGAAKLTMRLHPQDLAGLSQQVNRLVAEIAHLAAPDIVADEAIERGGCRVQSDFGSIDMQLKTQLERIEEELLAE